MRLKALRRELIPARSPSIMAENFASVGYLVGLERDRKLSLLHS